MSYSEPAPVKPEGRVRTLSLPDMEEKRSRGQETMHKVKASPSRLQFPEQSLKNLSPSFSLSMNSVARFKKNKKQKNSEATPSDPCGALPSIFYIVLFFLTHVTDFAEKEGLTRVDLEMSNTR